MSKLECGEFASLEDSSNIMFGFLSNITIATFAFINLLAMNWKAFCAQDYPRWKIISTIDIGLTHIFFLKQKEKSSKRKEQ